MEGTLMEMDGAKSEPATDEGHQAVIDKAMLHHKELIALAKKKGHLKPDGTIDSIWLQQLAENDDLNGNRAKLSILLQEMKNMKMSDESDGKE